MTSKTFPSLLASAVLVSLIPATHAQTTWVYNARAEVVSSIARVERQTVRTEQCHTESIQETAPSGHNLGGALIGGLAGGILGNQVGKGSGRAAATGIGIVAGAAIGDRMANPETPQVREVRRCVPQEVIREVVTGYDVTYRYQGRQYTQWMAQDPGAFVDLEISVKPRP